MKRRRLCTDLNELLAITVYDFDLNNDQFRNFCMAQGILHVAGIPNSIRWEFTRNVSLGKKDFLNHRVFQYSVTDRQFTKSEMEANWRIMQLARGHLQDAWEVFNEITEVPVLTGGVNPPSQIEQISLF